MGLVLDHLEQAFQSLLVIERVLGACKKGNSLNEFPDEEIAALRHQVEEATDKIEGIIHDPRVERIVASL